MTSPAAGNGPIGLWASVECAFLNTLQARWQLAADEVGSGFAQGKALFWRRDILEAAGGLQALGRELAEDAAATKIVRARRAAGPRRRLAVPAAARPAPGRCRLAASAPLGLDQKGRIPDAFRVRDPVGRGTADCRRGPAGRVSGVAPALALPLLGGFWYGTEWAVAVRAGWPASCLQVPTWILRDALIPVLWIASFTSRGYVWRSNAMAARPAPPLAAKQQEPG